MKKRKLGSSTLEVSEICLGSMTWGKQNNESEAHQQIDYALDQGINFIDTAELYPVPPSAQSFGLTERHIGRWLARNRSQRDKLVLATKIAGNEVGWIRNGGDITGKSVKQAVDGSLQRLNTDYIDLYQLHWTNRPSPHFAHHWPGMIDFGTVDRGQQQNQHLDILQALDECITAGKIRYCGLSNDTPWGIKEYLRQAELHDLPRMVSVQNEFSLLRLGDAPHIFEVCQLDNLAYLPWSPLAGGALSGKYRHGARPKGCRWSMQQRNGLFRDTTNSHRAIDAYYEVAQAHRLSLVELSLAWVYRYPGVTSTIIGATSMTQLKENIDALNKVLSANILDDINQVIRQYPVPF